MASLLECPREILYSILDLVPVASRHALSLVNKHLRVITEPSLYSRIEMVWKINAAPPITQLLRTLMSRPELSSYIKGLHLSGRLHALEGVWFLVKRPPTIPEAVMALDMNGVIDFIECTEIPEGKDWIEDIKSGKMDAIVALLVSLLPNLKSLHLHDDFAIENAMLGIMLRYSLSRSSGNSLPKFRSLREVTLDCVDDPARNKKVRRTTDIISFFYLPAVQHMSLKIDNPVKFAWPEHIPSPAALTSLNLRRIREVRLEPLLSVTKALKYLRWDWQYSPDMDSNVSKPVLDYDSIAAALSHVRSTLVELLIEAECYEPGFERVMLETKGSLNAFANLEKVKKLEVPWPFLMGFTPSITERLENAIPSNIEVLIITDDLILLDSWEWNEFTMFYAIQSWLGNWRAATPNLRRISLNLKRKMGEWGLEIRREFGNLCTQAGIEWEIVKREDDWDITPTPPRGWVWRANPQPTSPRAGIAESRNSRPMGGTVHDQMSRLSLT